MDAKRFERFLFETIKSVFDEYGHPFHKGCVKVLSRNKRRGHFCNKKTPRGDVFCTIHSNKRPGYSSVAFRESITAHNEPILARETMDGRYVFMNDPKREIKKENIMFEE